MNCFRNISKPVRGRATNNTAEIQACIAAIESCVNHGEIIYIFICIYTKIVYVSTCKKIEAQGYIDTNCFCYITLIKHDKIVCKLISQ